MNLNGFEQIRLVGDEDCGVGLQCDAAECWNGGLPIAYLRPYAGYPDVYPASEVVTVGAIADLLAVGRKHLDERHGGG